MRFFSPKPLIVVVALFTLAAFSSTFVEAGNSPFSTQEENEGALPTPTQYFGSNGGISELSLSASPSGLAEVSGTDGVPSTTTSWDFVITGATPGGSGLIASSFAPANVNSFGLSFLIAIDPTNLITFGYFGYGFSGEIIIPNISQSVPALAGTTVFIQAFETAPLPKTSNGLTFPLTF